LENNKTDLIDYQYKLKNNIKDILVWNKNIAPPHINKGTFSTKWEYVFAFSENNKSRSFPCQWQGKFNNVIETENASGNQFANIHKATFPVSFPSWIIEKMDFAKSILDVFMGTGTTMVAAHQLNRKCYGMELDPKYCQVIIDRMAKLDETLNIKINGKPYKTKAD
jgi:DNA modification methylase